MVERYTVGKNRYNKRLRASYGMGPEDAAALRDALSAPLAIAEARLEPALEWAISTLAQAGFSLDPNAWCYSDKEWRRKNERRSAEWYAITIIHKADWLRRMLEKGDARMAADFALDLGELITEAHFILGAFAGTAALGGERKAANNRAAVKGRIDECRRQAVEVWKRNSTLSASEVAAHIKNIALTPGYIRKKIADLDPKKRQPTNLDFY
jgi:hypothetical protein